MKHTFLYGAILALFNSSVFAITLSPGDTYTGGDYIVDVNGGSSIIPITINNSNMGIVTSNDASLTINDSSLITLNNHLILGNQLNETTLNRVVLQNVSNDGHLFVNDSLNTIHSNVQYNNNADGVLHLSGTTTVDTLTNVGVTYNQSSEEIHTVTNSGDFYNQGPNGNVWSINNSGYYVSSAYTGSLDGANTSGVVLLQGDSVTDNIWYDFNRITMEDNSVTNDVRLNTGTLNINDNARVAHLETLDLNSTTTNLYSGNLETFDVSNMDINMYGGVLGKIGTINYLRNGSALNMLQTANASIIGQLHINTNSIFYAENPNAIYSNVLIGNGGSANILEGNFTTLTGQYANVTLNNNAIVNTFFAGNSTSLIDGSARITNASLYKGSTTISGSSLIGTLNIESNWVDSAYVTFNGGEVQNVNALSDIDIYSDLYSSQLTVNGGVIHNLANEFAHVDYNGGVINNMNMAKNATMALSQPLSLQNLTLLQGSIDVNGINTLTTNTLQSTIGTIQNIDVNLNNAQSDALITVTNNFSGNLALGLNVTGAGADNANVLLISLLNDNILDETVTLSGNNVNLITGMQVKGAYQMSTSPYLWNTVREVNGWYLQSTPLLTPTATRLVTAPAIAALSTAQSVTGGLRQHLSQPWNAEMGSNLWGHMIWDNDVIDITNDLVAKNDIRGFDVGLDVSQDDDQTVGGAISYRGMHHTVEQSASGLTNSIQNDSTALVATLYGRYKKDEWEHKGQLFAGQIWSTQNYDNGQDNYKGTLYGAEYELGYRVNKGDWSYLPYVGLQATHSNIEESYQALQSTVGLDVNYEDDEYVWSFSPKMNYKIHHTDQITLSDKTQLTYQTPKMTYGFDIGVTKETKEDSWFIKVGSKDIQEKAWAFSFGGSVKF